MQIQITFSSAPYKKKIGPLAQCEVLAVLGERTTVHIKNCIDCLLESKVPKVLTTLVAGKVCIHSESTFNRAIGHNFICNFRTIHVVASLSIPLVVAV